jgi:4-hydroxybenzoate polyprenyltransferase
LTSSVADTRRLLRERLRLYLALSRTPHGLLDMAAPAMAALLWLGGFPPARTFFLGVLTTVAGYTAVYALNDVIGYRSDKRKFEQGAFSEAGGDLDAVLVRHPMAQGRLSLLEGTLWAGAWAVLAFVGAWLLNPACVAIFLLACLLETVYCLLWRISPFRAVVSGAVKSAGPLAAVYAVDPSPAPVFAMVLFLTLFFWEIGGQNVPNDWADISEDRRFGGQTIPIRFGIDNARGIVLAAVGFAIVLSLVLFRLPPSPAEPGFLLLVLLAGIFLLAWPALRLYRSGDPGLTMVLFNRASYYPLALLAIILLRLAARAIH